MNTWWSYFVILWLSTFTEGLLLPILVGMIINTVPAEERPTAYSVSLVLERLLGMSLGPILYGYLIDSFPKIEIVGGKAYNISRAGMKMLYWSSIFGVITLGLALKL